MINEWDLTQTNLKRLSNRTYEVAVMATSAIEPHNRHLPEGQDFFHANHIARESCKKAWEKCKSVIYMPGIPYGVDSNLMDFPMAIHVAQATLNAMLRDVIMSLRHYGIRKIVILNGHGGNDFSPFVRDIQSELDVHLFVCHWWKVGFDQYDDIFDKPDDHAGHMETSIALALFPELVELENAGDGKARPFRFQALQEGWVQTSRRFSRMNDHCATGDPGGASADKGQKYLDLVIGRISDFLINLANEPIDDLFPHQK